MQAGGRALPRTEVKVVDRLTGQTVPYRTVPLGTVRSGLPQAQLADYCRERLAGFKGPVRWLFTDAFPLTSTGKIRKDVLSAQFAEEGAEAGKVPSSATS